MPPPEPFADSADHLLAELERIDLLIRSRVARLRRVQSQDENFRGLYISEEEVDALLARPLGAPQWLQGTGGEGDGLADVDAALCVLEENLAARRAESLARGIDLRLDRLARTFGLDAFDGDLLLVCLAVEIDLRYEKLYAYLQDDVTKRRPSVDLMLRLLSPDGRDALAARRHFLADAPLLAHRLVHLPDDPSQPHPPLLARAVKPDDRIVQFLLGADAMDERLAGVAEVVVPSRGLGDLRLRDDARERFRHAWGPDDDAPAAVLLLVGPSGSGRRSVAEALCAEHGRALVVADASAIAADAEPARRLTEIAPLVEREARLRGAAVLWRGLDGFAVEQPQRAALVALLRAVDGGRTPAFVTGLDASEASSSFPRRGAAVLKLPPPSHDDRAAAWTAALGDAPVEPDADVDGIASRFHLTFGAIGQAAATARRQARLRGGEDAPVARRDLQDACRLHSNQKLASLARKTSQHYHWDDIVLPPDRLAQLREICNQVKYRDLVWGDWGFGRKLALGKGLAVLFAGPSGTGKTMAAGVLAAELGLDLYKIDLSAVISKYIGETEKNLSRIFDEAETSNAILFFDEADALFGKRSEVRDSHDRYANVEVGYLLQRMEEYEGIAILATNFRKNMDDAFVRRLHFTVEFPLPDHGDRLRIWQSIWPDATPRDPALDLDRLAGRYELSGGNIKNVAVAAAFLAADDNRAVGMDHLLQATLREYQKTGKLMGDDDDDDPYASGNGRVPRQ